MALEIGAMKYGLYNNCHATPMVYEYGGLNLSRREENYRKFYFLGIMININGKRFLDIKILGIIPMQYGRKVMNNQTLHSRY